jgi:hypothetical protein
VARVAFLMEKVTVVYIKLMKTIDAGEKKNQLEL